MPDLLYSDDALNVRSAFLSAKTIVYVEGDDDVLFWQAVFSEVADEHFEVESVGGSPTLDEYIQKISSGQLRAIAARDSDFLSILGIFTPDPKIVYTHGYSIENSLYVAEAVRQLACAWCKSNRVSPAQCESWLEKLAKTITPLVHLDVANATSASGVPTLGDNCTRFMTSSSSAIPCPIKVAEMVALSSPKLPRSAITSAESAIGTTPDAILRHMRGHFLASAILRFIVKQAKAFGRRVSISAESLYAAAFANFAATIGTRHPHSSYYLEAAKAAWQSV